MILARRVYHRHPAGLEVVVNTWNREDLAVQTMTMLRTQAAGAVRLVVVDDSSQDLRWAKGLADETVSLRHCGAAMARRHAMRDALQRRGPACVLFVDSDLVFAQAYDVKTLELINEAEHLTAWALATPYRSTSHLDGDQPLKPGYVLGSTFGGATLALRRSKISHVLAQMPKYWDHLYDWVLCEKFKAVKPVKSLADHVGGRRPDALHPGSWDCGVDFYC